MSTYFHVWMSVHFIFKYMLSICFVRICGFNSALQSAKMIHFLHHHPVALLECGFAQLCMAEVCVSRYECNRHTSKLWRGSPHLFKFMIIFIYFLFLQQLSSCICSSVFPQSSLEVAWYLLSLYFFRAVPHLWWWSLLTLRGIRSSGACSSS